MSEAVIHEQRYQDVWLGDVVRLGAGRTEWTVAEAGRSSVVLVSPKGTKRWTRRDRVTLIRRCPDGPQLEDWSDGRAYLGAELVLSTAALADSVVWWRDEPGRTGEAHPCGVSLAVCCPSSRDGGQRLLKVSAFGTASGGLLPREDVLRLAESLLRISNYL